MDDYLVSTFPIKPYENINVGLLIGPVICEIIGDVLNAKKVLSFNLLHSFEEKNDQLEGYLQKIANFDIKYDYIVRDLDNVEKYLEFVEKLHHSGYIEIAKNIVFRCECGKVDILGDSIINNKVGNLYYLDSGKIYCKSCGKECKPYNESNLFLVIKENKLNDIKVVPFFLKNEIKELNRKFSSKKILISKNRNTNYSLTINGQNYNVDIDMLWIMFNQYLQEQNQILVTSNHQMYQMFLSNYINNILENKNVMYVATPYLINNENIDINSLLYDSNNTNYKKLAILYSLKWKNKSINWNKNLLMYLNKLNNEQLEFLINNIKNSTKDDNFKVVDYLNDLFFKKINFDNDIRKMVRKI